VFAGAVGVAAVLYRVFGRGPEARELWRPMAVGLAVWAVVWFGLVAPIQLAAIESDGVFDRLHVGERLQIVGDHFGPLARFAVAAAVVGLAARTRVGAVAAVAVGLVAAGVGYAAARIDPRAADTAFVRATLAERWTGSGPPTVYWPGRPVRTVWLDLRMNSYFSLPQLAGNTFSRGNAVEGSRRTEVAAPFELDRFRRDFGRHTHLTGEDLGDLSDLPPPSPEQFRDLVADPAVDFVVLPTDFGGSVASNGSVFVYDCRERRRSGVTP
jgi:hypothetical protein